MQRKQNEDGLVARETVHVPDIGGAEAAEVVELLVAAGDEIAQDDGLVVLESDKASMEIPATAAGKVLELLVKEGDQLAEGDEVALIETADDGSPEEESGDGAGTGEGADFAGDDVADPADKDSKQAADTADAASGSGDDADNDASSAAVGSSADQASEFRSETAASPGNDTTERMTVCVPDIGGAEAAEVIELLVAVGDSIDIDDGLVVLESDKASLEVPASAAGKVVELLVKEGDQLAEGDEVAIVEVAGDTKPAPSSTPGADADAGRSGGDVEKATADKTEAESAKTEPTQAEPTQAEPTQAEPTQTEPARAEDAGAAVYAGPAVRKLAREFGIPLEKVSGSGPRGRLLKEDLHTYAQKTMQGEANALPAATEGAGIPPVPEVDFSAFGEVAIEKRGKLDLLTAANMQRSWLNLPHVTHFDEVDISELEAFRKSLKAEAEQRDTRLTPMPFLIKASAVALRQHPKFNASLTDGGKSLAYKQYFHVGMAVDTPAG
ncbi:MAG: biotin/lipoyl-containing protein, partial [Chromatocurvus sp.]